MRGVDGVGVDWSGLYWFKGMGLEGWGSRLVGCDSSALVSLEGEGWFGLGRLCYLLTFSVLICFT